MSSRYYNNEGYRDPTAGAALSAYDKAVLNYENDIRKSKEKDDVIEHKKNFPIKILKFIIDESGFELIGRIQIKHRESGSEYR